MPWRSDQVRKEPRCLRVGDVERILRHADSETGLSCTDTEIPDTEIRGDLRDPESHLFQSLFETTRRLRRCGHEYRSEYPAISDAEFFRDGTNAGLEIALVDVLVRESGELCGDSHVSFAEHAARCTAVVVQQSWEPLVPHPRSDRQSLLMRIARDPIVDM